MTQLTQTRRIVGIDLGQARDHTAIAVAEVTTRPTGETRIETRRPGIRIDGQGPATYQVAVPLLERQHDVVYLERLPLGTSYVDQVKRIVGLCRDLHEPGLRVEVLVDTTGVGRPVVDMLRPQVPRIPVIITAGDNATRENGFWRVPKRDLVGAVQVLLQKGLLKIADGLELADTLIKELLAFKVSINARGYARYGNDVGDWRENPHDDLVLATALACWWGERAWTGYRSRRSRVVSMWE